MFEDSTFESNGRIRTRSRRWMIATLTLNSSILLALILIPLIYPEALPHQSMAFLMTARCQRQPHRRAAVQERTSPTGLSRRCKASRSWPRREFLRGIVILRITRNRLANDTLATLDSAGRQLPTTPSTIFSGRGATARRSARGHRSCARLNWRGSQRMLLRKTVPAYPAIPRAVGLQGTVTLASDDLEGRDHRESARDERPAHAATGGDRRREDLGLPAVSARRPAGRGRDHRQCDLQPGAVKRIGLR